MQKLLIINVVAILMLCGSTALAGAAPQLLNYQAVLLDGNGDPVTTEVSVKFAIYDAASDGTELWTETSTITPNDDGAFDHILGQEVKGSIGDLVFAGPDRWLGITVGADAELSPRTRLVSSAYSMRVSTVDQSTAGELFGSMKLSSSAKAVASLTIAGSGSDSIYFNSSSGTILSATNGDGYEVVNFNTNGDNNSALFVVRGPGGDEETVFSSGGMNVSAETATRAMENVVSLTRDGFTVFSTDDPADELVNISEDAAACGGQVEVSACALGRGITRTVRIAPAVGEVLKATEANNDDVLLLAADANGASFMVAASDAAKLDPKVVTSSVLIEPATNTVLKAVDNTGESLIELSTADAEGVIILTNPAKAGSRVEIKEDGIYFYDATRSETTMVITADGSINGQGSLTMGQNVVNDGNWCNVLGVDNEAVGDSSAVLGGFKNFADGQTSVVVGGSGCSTYVDVKGTPNNAAIVGGSKNTTCGRRSFIGGGAENKIVHQYGVIGGGLRNYIAGWAASIPSGEDNYINHNSAYSCIPGGLADTIGGIARFSMAFGNEVLVEEAYRVVFFEADSSGALAINRDNDGSTTIDHPIHVGTNTENGNGAYLTTGGVWTLGVGKAYNKSMGRLDGSDVLKRINDLPVEQWECNDTGERHIWPDAEGFHTQFDVGVLSKDGTRNTENLAAIDVAGVALVGVQELYRMVQEQQLLATEFKDKDLRIEQLEMRLTQMEAMMETILAAKTGTDNNGQELANNR
ncbi:MAG: hypothetical protein KOO62_09225 [candidate division Zixibacteria bacterium]|nr:hypothetical protein [candidate division Zixibacteria bacterium]